MQSHLKFRAIQVLKFQIDKLSTVLTVQYNRKKPTLFKKGQNYNTYCMAKRLVHITLYKIRLKS